MAAKRAVSAHLARRMVAIATVLAMASCGDGGATEPPPSLAEVYTLETVDGRPLPAVIDTVYETEWTLTGGALRVSTVTFNGRTSIDVSRELAYSLRRGDGYESNGAEVALFRLRQEGRSVILTIGTPPGHDPALARSDTGRLEADGRLMVRTRIVSPDGPRRVLSFAPSDS